ncbi:MAG: antibiotic resistance protein MarC, partial [Candidatus Kuenenia stuttgartiensis]
MEHWTEYTRFLTALMVILDPFAAIPIFLSLTQGYSQSQRARVVLVTIITVALVLISSAISGESLLKTFGTSLASFRVGGGIVLFIMALAMLRAQADKVKTSPTEEAAAENKATIAVVPLAIPLLAGPGSISTVI